MTRIYLAGAESVTHQELLISCQVQRVGVNVTSLLRRRSDTWVLDLPYPGWGWVAYSDSDSTIEDLDWVCERVTIPPTWVIGPESWSATKGYLPVWNGDGPISEVLVQGSPGMMVIDRVFKDKQLNRRALAARSVGKILGAITGSIDTGIGRYDLIISGSWWSSFKFGETQIWDGNRMHRYGAERRAEVRTRHRKHIENLGVDADKILEGDPDESARLAIVSWQSFENDLSGPPPVSAPPVATIDPDDVLVSVGSAPAPIATTATQPRLQTVLPVVSIGSITATERHGDGTETLEHQAVLQSVSETIRACDNCFLGSAGCPGFQPGQTCAYSIPVEIRSKDQLQGVLTAMIELQTQRVLQARFAEEVAGQELTPEVGREMDRLFGAVEKMRDIMDNRDSIKMTVEARGRSGVLSRLFGDRVGTNAKMLAEPVESEEVLDAVLEGD